MKHIGAADVRLDVLKFPHSKGSNKTNVERLARLFNGQRGYEPADSRNRIPAIIGNEDLDTALVLSGLDREALHSQGSKCPKLEFPPGFRLECLSGHDRAQASEEISRLPEPRWVVNLFTAGV